MRPTPPLQGLFGLLGCGWALACSSPAADPGPASACDGCELVAPISGVTSLLASTGAIYASVVDGPIMRLDPASHASVQVAAAQPLAYPRLAATKTLLAWAEPDTVDSAFFVLRSVALQGGKEHQSPPRRGAPRLAATSAAVYTSYLSETGTNRIVTFPDVNATEELLFETESTSQASVLAASDQVYWCIVTAEGSNWYSQLANAPYDLQPQSAPCATRYASQRRVLLQSSTERGEQCVSVVEASALKQLFCAPRVDALVDLSDASVVFLGEGKVLWRALPGQAPNAWLTLDALPIELAADDEHVYFATTDGVSRVKWR